MKRARGPEVVGTYLVWRRGPIFVRLALLLCAAAATARFLPAVAPAGSAAALFLAIIGVPSVMLVVAWLGLRRARTPTRISVSTDGLALEPFEGAGRRSWRWAELRLSLHRDDEDGTLALRGPFPGELLVGKDHGSSMAALLDAIHRAGGAVSDVS